MLAAMSWAGSLPTWLLLGMGLIVSWRVTKGGGGAAVTELSEANKVLERRTHELGAEVRDLKVENERLKARTDFAQALAPILDGVVAAADRAARREETIITTLAQHEERAETRFQHTTNVLGLIAERLGPESPEPGPERRSGERRSAA